MVASAAGDPWGGDADAAVTPRNAAFQYSSGILVSASARTFAPKVSLGTLALAAQFVGLLWPTLLLLGVERVRIVAGPTAVTPLLFEDYPISRSLAAVAGWSVEPNDTCRRARAT